MRIIDFSAILSVLVPSLLVTALVTTKVNGQEPIKAPPITNSEVDLYVAQHGHTPHSDPPKPSNSDPFSIPVATPPRSLDIILEYPFARKVDEYQSGPKWEYSIPDKNLSLSFFVSSLVAMAPDWEGTEPNSELRYAQTATFEVSEKKRSVQGGTRQNSYGAKVDVVTEYTTIRGIMARATKVGQSARPKSDDYDYIHTVIIEPNEARELVSNLRLEVHARAVQWRPGDYVQCASRYSAPTIRNQRESVLRACFLSTEIISLRIIDARDRSILREWKE